MPATHPVPRVRTRAPHNRLRGDGREVEGRFVRVLGRRVRLLEAGEGEPVLLLHGVGGWAEHWQGVLPALAGVGFRAMACDLPGFGHSEAPDAVQYFDPEDPYYARFVRELLDALGLERVALVGHSMGGAISMVSALRMPERVERLVLVAPGGFGELMPGKLRLLSTAVLARLAPRVPPALLCGLLPARVVRGIVRANFHDPTCVPKWLVQEALAFARAGAAAEVTRVMGQLLVLRGPRCDLRDAWCAEMQALRCPTLLVWGRQDRTIPCAQAEAARTFLPGSRLELIEDAGHLVMLEQAQRFQEVLLDFLREPVDGTPALPEPAVASALNAQLVAAGERAGLVHREPPRAPPPDEEEDPLLN